MKENLWGINLEQFIFIQLIIAVFLTLYLVTPTLQFHYFSLKLNLKHPTLAFLTFLNLIFIKKINWISFAHICIFAKERFYISMISMPVSTGIISIWYSLVKSEFDYFHVNQYLRKIRSISRLLNGNIIPSNPKTFLKFHHLSFSPYLNTQNSAILNSD